MDEKVISSLPDEYVAIHPRRNLGNIPPNSIV
jgi:hypothetical protein